MVDIMKKYFLFLFFSIFFVSLYGVPSYAVNLLAGGPCEDGPSHCDASGLGYDDSGCLNSCIDGNTCWNGFGANPSGQTCSLSVGPKGYMCWYLYQDPNKPSCGECGVPTCSGLAGWWCAPDNSKCSGGKICDATNTCVCPFGKVWDPAEGKCTSPSCLPCDSGATPCAPTDPEMLSCSRDNPGKRCVNQNGVGVLQDDKSCTDCKKFNVVTGINTGGGPNKDAPEICVDTYVKQTGFYKNFKVDEYSGTGALIKETFCDPTTNKCAQKDPPEKCTASQILSKMDVSKTNIVNILKNIPAIPAGTNTYYCDNGGGGSIIPPTPGPLPPPACATCGNPAVCVGECVPGDPPYKYDAACGKVADCGKCGCGPAQYKCTLVSCNAATGFCSYNSPPGLCGDVPDCTLTTPDFEFNKTIVTTSTYLLSGNNLGSFSGYKWNGASWQSDSIDTGLSEASYSSPAVFLNDSNTYLVSGRGDGGFSGYSWDGTKWNANALVNSGLPDIGSNSKPAVFYMDGVWNLIAGNNTGEFSGFTCTGAGWVSNASITNNLTDIGDNSAPTVFYKDGIYYMISGERTGIFYGFYWNGSDWLSDSSIISGLADAGDNSAPYVFFNNTDMYLITGKETGQFSGYKWGGTQWQADGTMTAGLSAINSRSAPTRFSIDTTSLKTMTYSTRFPLESMFEYPGAGSDCYQNKTQIIIPEGHACAMNIYANSTAGWGVRLETTTTPGKTLAQSLFDVCGYENYNLFSICYPDAVGNPGTPKCIVNQTPVLQAGTYEFGIVSATGIANNKVSKACAYITQCADCENPYAQYYCNLCVNDRCSDKLQDCGETCVDGGGSCQTGSETDNSYIPVFVYTPGPGLINTLLFNNGNGGLNCVDGIDNDHDCLTDCQDPDCDGSTVCSIDIIPPETSISFNPPNPNTKGWYLSEVEVTLKCADFGKGCDTTKYRIDDGEWVASSGTLPVYFTISLDGIHTIEYYSIDRVNNVEPTKSSIVKLYTSPPFALTASAKNMIVPVGSYGQLLVTVKNLMTSKDTITLTLEGLPSKLHKWIWFVGHKEDSERYGLSLELEPGEEQIIPVDVFGGEVLSGDIKLTAESSTTGAISEISAGVDILYSDNSIAVQTPEFGWAEFIIIALLAVALI